MKNKKLIFIIAMAALIPAFALTTCKVQPAENDNSALALLMLMNRPGGGVCECTGAEDCDCAVCDCEECETVITHIVTFNSNDGSFAPEQEIVHGGKAAEPENVTKENHMLAGWYRNAELTIEWNFDTDTVTGSITLYAKWTENPPGTHTVTFNNNGGLPHIEQQLIADGCTVGEPEAIAREGYIFNGWYKDPACTILWNFDTDVVTGDTTIYAKWTEDPSVITYNVSADSHTDTTSLSFTFSAEVSGLTSGDINIHSGGGIVTKGLLTGDGTEWQLGVTVTAAGYVTVSINKSGIQNTGKSVYVYKGSVVQPSDITYNASANGVSNMADSTQINFVFSAPVSLTAGEINITNGTGSVTKGAVGGSGASWTLGVTVLTAGNITVSITQNGIESVNKTVAVHKVPAVSAAITYTAEADNNTDTTAINFEFSDPVSSLTVQQINIINIGGSVIKGALTGSGTSWHLGVEIVIAGEITVSINRTGIERPAKTVTVYKPIPDITYTAEADNISYTNAINFTFDAPVYGLTAGDIVITDGSGTVTKGTLSGSGASYSLGVVVTNAGNVTVSIPGKEGIESEGKTVAVYRGNTITYTPAVVNDADSTTAITFTFSVPVSGLSAADITISGGSGAATKGMLTGSGTNWTLSVNDVTGGNVNISISRTGIESAGKQIALYKAVTYTAAADGNINADTTVINFEFSATVNSLTAADIVITGGTASLTKNSVSGSGTSWSLNVTVISAGSVYFNINKTGIESVQKQVTAYKVTVYSVSADNPTNTTALNFTFSVPVNGLSANDITVTGDGGAVTKGLVSGGGTNWSLGVTVISAGNVTVSISKDGIESGNKTAAVYKTITYSVSADGAADVTSTTVITLMFSESADSFNLTAGDITLSSLSGSVIKGALTGSGDTRNLDVTVIAAGYINVSINKTGIESVTKQVQVHKKLITYTVSADGAADITTTTGITLSFSENVVALALSDIAVSNGSGSVTNPSLSGSGSTWTLGVTVVTQGTVNITIGQTGIESGTKQVTVYKNAGAVEALLFTLLPSGNAYSVSKGTMLSPNVVIPSVHTGDEGTFPVTEIPAGGFQDYTNLKTIVIPDSVTEIGAGAFNGCGALEEITIPFVGANRSGNALAATPNAYFYYLFGASAASIPSTLKIVTISPLPDYTLPFGAFQNTNLTSITLNNGVTSIGLRAFYLCSSLVSVDIPNGVTLVGDESFQGTSISNIVIPNSVTQLGRSNGNGGVFRNCTQLISVTLGTGVTEIISSTFIGCSSLSSVTMNGTVTSIGNTAFQNCTSLTNIDFLPNTSITFYDNAFRNTGLTSVTIPSTWTLSIGLFRDCAQLTNVTIENGRNGLSTSLFQGCTSLTNNGTTSIISIPNSVATINTSAFQGSGLTQITIPAGVTTINDQAFQSCSSLQTVTFAPRTTNISIANGTQGAFRSCTSLVSITIPAQMASIGNLAFAFCNNLATVIFEGSSTTINNNNSFPYNTSGTSLLSAYSSGGGAGTYTRDATGSNTVGSWTKSP